MDRFEQVKAYAQEKLQFEVAAHDFSHSDRVMRLAKHIGQEMDESVDLEVISIAGITHDVIDRKVAPDMKAAIEGLSRFLESVGYDEALIGHVQSIIQNMSYSSGKIPDSLEGKIVQDADRLEAIGAIAIARTFAYGGKMNRLIYQENDSDCSIAHFYDKLLLLKDKMHTDKGRAIAEKRHAFMEKYLEAFYDEWHLRDIEL